MPNKKKDATPQATPGSAMAHSIEIDRLTLRNAKIEAKLDAVTEELVLAKDALKKIESDYKAEVATKLKMDIQTVLGITDSERDKLCHGKTDEELSQMLDNFVTATNTRPAGESGTFKHIRTGAVKPREYGDTSENLTVGNLFNKSREEILKMGGKF